MNSAHVSSCFHDLAQRLSAIREELRQLEPALRLSCDQRAARWIGADLVWAAENCSVIAAHVEGRALHDNMGFGEEPTSYAKICPTCGRALAR